MARKTLFMETTSVESSRTAGEIQTCLVGAGATQVSNDYQDGKITGLRWVMKVQGQDVIFDMPARIEPVFKIINGRRSWPPGHATQDKAQAERVAWRQLLRWVQAQVAMIETGMVQAHEVFMPYIFDPIKNQTLFQRLEESKFKLLEAPKQ